MPKTRFIPAILAVILLPQAPQSLKASGSRMCHPITTPMRLSNGRRRRGVTVGYGDGTFKPEEALSRWHAVTFMERYYDDILRADESEDFTRADMVAAPRTCSPHRRPSL